MVCGTTLAAIAQQYEDAYRFEVTQVDRRGLLSQVSSWPLAGARNAGTASFSLIVTTSQDQLLAQALNAVNMNKTASVQRYHAWGDKRDNPEFEITGSPSAPVIYHLFGHADEPESLVLSENDVLDFLKAVISGSSPMPNSLLRVLKSKEQSFLFLGFGVRRWDLRMLLKILLKTWEQDQGSIAAESLQGWPTRIAKRWRCSTSAARGWRLKTPMRRYVSDAGFAETSDGGRLRGQEYCAGCSGREFSSAMRAKITTSPRGCSTPDPAAV